MLPPDIKKIFTSETPPEKMYQSIILLGKELPSFDSTWKVESNLVKGCQSIMYLKSIYEEETLRFYTYSEALISRGLAALMIAVYNKKSPEWVLTNKPNFLNELGILSSLTPSRANGTLSLYQKMQQEALAALKNNLL